MWPANKAHKPFLSDLSTTSTNDYRDCEKKTDLSHSERLAMTRIAERAFVLRNSRAAIICFFFRFNLLTPDSFRISI